MNRSLSSLCLVAALLAMLATSCRGGKDEPSSENPALPTQASPGVSSLSYSPRPYYKDMTKMRVRFTTTNPVPPNRAYTVSLFTGLSHRDGTPCYPEFAYPYDYNDPPLRGGVGKTVSVTLVTDAPETVREEDIDKVGPNDTHACTGRARLVVRYETPQGSRVMRRLSFRILPARSH